MPIPKREELDGLRSLLAGLRNSKTIKHDGRTIEVVRPQQTATPAPAEPTPQVVIVYVYGPTTPPNPLVDGSRAELGFYTGRIQYAAVDDVTTESPPAGQGVFRDDENECVVFNLASENGGFPRIVFNQYYLGLLFRTNSSGKPVVVINEGIRQDVMYRVYLTQTGGSGGSNSPPTAPTWTYSARLYVNTSDNTVGTGLSPTWGRYLAAAHAAGTEGMGYFNSAGEFVLLTTNEKPTTTGCA